MVNQVDVNACLTALYDFTSTDKRLDVEGAKGNEKVIVKDKGRLHNKSSDPALKRIVFVLSQMSPEQLMNFEKEKGVDHATLYTAIAEKFGELLGSCGKEVRKEESVNRFLNLFRDNFFHLNVNDAPAVSTRSVIAVKIEDEIDQVVENASPREPVATTPTTQPAKAPPPPPPPPAAPPPPPAPAAKAVPTTVDRKAEQQKKLNESETELDALIKNKEGTVSRRQELQGKIRAHDGKKQEIESFKRMQRELERLEGNQREIMKQQDGCMSVLGQIKGGKFTFNGISYDKQTVETKTKAKMRELDEKSKQNGSAIDKVKRDLASSASIAKIATEVASWEKELKPLEGKIFAINSQIQGKLNEVNRLRKQLGKNERVLEGKKKTPSSSPRGGEGGQGVQGALAAEALARRQKQFNIDDILSQM